MVDNMTFQEAHKDGKNGLVTRRGLTEDQLTRRLNPYFSNEEIDKIINSVKSVECWTDGEIAIVRTGANENIRFVAVANGNYMKLIEP